MTPHMLLVSNYYSSQRRLITVQAIKMIDSYRDGSLITTMDGDEYEVVESFETIIAMLGGLVLGTRVLPYQEGTGQ